MKGQPVKGQPVKGLKSKAAGAPGQVLNHSVLKLKRGAKAAASPAAAALQAGSPGSAAARRRSVAVARIVLSPSAAPEHAPAAAAGDMPGSAERRHCSADLAATADSTAGRGGEEVSVVIPAGAGPLGMRLERLHDTCHDAGGVSVASLARSADTGGGPLRAQLAGVRVGDRILAVGGQRVRSAAEASAALQRCAGEAVGLLLVRRGVPPAAEPAVAAASAPAPPPGLGQTAVGDWLEGVNTALAVYGRAMGEYGYENAQLVAEEEPGDFAAALQTIGVKLPHQRKLVRAQAALHTGIEPPATSGAQ